MQRVGLDDRKQGILKAVVNDYVRTAEPVGSSVLASRYGFGVKSATIRNEMAELAELGYLRQPHTSAGRIPSDLGYRFYVDRLMEDMTLPVVERSRVRKRLASHAAELDLILEETCRILSDLARYTSLATDPNIHDCVVRHISIAGVTRVKLLAVVVLDNGHVIHHLIKTDTTTRAIDCVRATNYLNEKLGGVGLNSIEAVAAEPDDPADLAALLSTVLDFLKRELELAEEVDVHLGGTNYIFHQPEFRDAERLETVLSVLEERRSLWRLMSSVYPRPAATVIIGRENPLDRMRDLSFVGARYRVVGRAAGTIGVVGPTRMDYSRAVAAVEFMAANLSDLLSTLSLG